LSSGFDAGEQRWRAGLQTLRQVVRQELVARQLAGHLPAAPARILDVGCGQGTQLLRLARAGHHVTGLDASAGLLADLDAGLAGAGPDVAGRVRTVRGDALQAAALLAPETFDAVLCHGVLMYFADPMPLLGELARLVAPGGILSLLVRNANGLAMRPGLLGDWAAAQRAFDDASYGNRIGVIARADRLEELAALLGGRRLGLRAWYGVRVFTDLAASDAPVPAGPELAELLACEERAGATDPYRRVAALTHLIADRGPA
jgi:S-adenosylmethionine-dependent methyltransferase